MPDAACRSETNTRSCRVACACQVVRSRYWGHGKLWPRPPARGHDRRMRGPWGEVLLARHGQTEWNLQRLADPPTARGQPASHRQPRDDRQDAATTPARHRAWRGAGGQASAERRLRRSRWDHLGGSCLGGRQPIGGCAAIRDARALPAQWSAVTASAIGKSAWHEGHVPSPNRWLIIWATWGWPW
jgi:hypothetical protein